MLLPNYLCFVVEENDIDPALFAEMRETISGVRLDETTAKEEIKRFGDSPHSCLAAVGTPQTSSLGKLVLEALRQTRFFESWFKERVDFVPMRTATLKKADLKPGDSVLIRLSSGAGWTSYHAPR